MDSNGWVDGTCDHLDSDACPVCDFDGFNSFLAWRIQDCHHQHHCINTQQQISEVSATGFNQQCRSHRC